MCGRFNSQSGRLLYLAFAIRGIYMLLSREGQGKCSPFGLIGSLMGAGTMKT